MPSHLTTSNLPLFRDLDSWTCQVPIQYCSLWHRTLLLSPVTSRTGYCFCFGSIFSFFLELFLHSFSVTYWAPTDLGSSSFIVKSFCIFILSQTYLWMVECLLWRYRSAVACFRGRGSGCSRPGWDISPLGGGCYWPHHRATRTYTGLGKQTLGGHKQNLVCTRTQEKGVSSRGVGQWWPAAGSGILSEAVGAQDLLKEVTIIFITSTKMESQVKQQGGNIALPISRKLKIYWAWLCPSEQDPVAPTVSLSHQEASRNLLSLSIRGQTEWKAQLQKTNQTDHVNHSLI